MFRPLSPAFHAMPRLLLLTLGLLVSAAPALAQRSISYGQSQSGTLARGGSQTWTFTARAGDVVTIDVESSAFDTVAELQDPTGRQLARNDDGGSGTNSRIDGVRLDRAGLHRIIVTSYASSGSGRYTVRLARTGSGGSASGGTIAYGQTRNGYLGGGERHRYTFSGRAGDVVTIEMPASFDSYLELLSPSGSQLTTDDDSGEGTSALISGYRLRQTGTHTIVARGFSSAGSGSYSLSLYTDGGGYSGGSECSGYAEYGGVRVGSRIRLGRHTMAGGSTNWTSDMARYVGREARVTRLGGTDAQGCTVVYVDADDGAYMWRLRDAQVSGAGSGRAPTMAACRSGAMADYGGVRVGSMIELGAHEFVNGGNNWADEMWDYVGQRARVTRLDGVDSEGCATVRVDIDGGEWQWRVRDAVRL